jgi:hypothetical protein
MVPPGPPGCVACNWPAAMAARSRRGVPYSPKFGKRDASARVNGAPEWIAGGVGKDKAGHPSGDRATPSGTTPGVLTVSLANPFDTRIAGSVRCPAGGVKPIGSRWRSLCFPPPKFPTLW